MTMTLCARGPRARRMLIAFLAAGMAGLAPLGGVAAEPEPPLPTVAEVTAKLDDLYRAKSSEATMTMEIVTKHYQRTLKMQAWSLGEDESLVVVREPAREAGNASLRTKEGLWSYAPRSDRLVRIPSGLLSESWLGSHLTNDDLMRESQWEDDYDTTLSWTTEGGTRYLKVTSVPKPETAIVYTRVVQLLRAGDWLPIRADFYDGDEVVRQMFFKDIKAFGKRLIPSVLEVRPSDAPKEYTRVVYQAMAFDVDVNKSLFTARGLRKAASSR